MFFQTTRFIFFVVWLLTVVANASPVPQVLCGLLKACPPAVFKCPKGQHFQAFKRQKRRMMNPIAAAAALLGICVEDVVPDLPVSSADDVAAVVSDPTALTGAASVLPAAALGNGTATNS